MITEFIIPTYDRISQLHSMLASLVAQNDNRWLATVVVDDIENERARSIIAKFDTNKIKCIFTEHRHNDFGHTPREIGKQLSAADYVIMTGDDNYYVPAFIKELNMVVSDKPGMVYWNMIHNGFDYKPFICHLMTGHIDMGAFATRVDLAKQIMLNKKQFAADGTFVNDFCVRFPTEKIIKIDKILFVHN